MNGFFLTAVVSLLSLCSCETGWCLSVAAPRQLFRVYLHSFEEGTAGQVSSLLAADDYRCAVEADVSTIKYYCSVAIRYSGPSARILGMELDIPSSKGQLRIGDRGEMTIDYSRGKEVEQEFIPGVDVRFRILYSGPSSYGGGIFALALDEHPVTYSDRTYTPVRLNECSLSMNISNSLKVRVHDEDFKNDSVLYSSKSLGRDRTMYEISKMGSCPHITIENPESVFRGLPNLPADNSVTGK